MRVFAIVAVVCAVAATAAAGVQKTPVALTAADGTALKGTYYAPTAPGPGVLLLHQCNMDRTSWDGLAGALADAGIHVMTLDFRGYGESPGERATDRDRRYKQMQELWPGDVDAAWAWLLVQKGVDKARVAAGGASCGVTMASGLASRTPAIHSLVLLSGRAGAALPYIQQTRALAVFGAASEDDDAAATIREVVAAASANPDTRLRMFKGDAHGVPMFGKEPTLLPEIVAWLQARLKAPASH